MTSPQTLEIPPLHTALETLTNPRELLADVIQATMNPCSRFSNDVHMLAGNKVNSGERSS